MSRSFNVPTAIGLSLGSRGAAVKDLQDFLGRFGYLEQTLPIEHPYAKLQSLSPLAPFQPGTFDQPTQAALEQYQAFHGVPVTGMLDEATLAEMSLPRCGVPDLADADALSRFMAQGNKWPTREITYGFQNFPQGLSAEQVRAAIAQAFQLWSQVTSLSFQDVPLTDQPHIVITFINAEQGHGSMFDGMGNVLAHAFFPPPNGGALAGDTQFDQSEHWSLALPVNGIDLVTVAAHELGHALGLAHSKKTAALMAPTYRGVKRHLDQDDINQIRAIYGITYDSDLSDIAHDLYSSEILEAVSLKFIAGFDDHTFRPQDFLTREQLVSMCLEALACIPALELQLPTQVEGRVFPDVDVARWSAAKIAFANRHQIIKGYPNGQFYPDISVTRAEMIVILRRAAEFARRRMRLDPALKQKQTPFPFSDIGRHWASDDIRVMSGYGGVASPLNEQGRRFRPKQAAQRNYGAAGTLRLLHCLMTEI